MCAGYQTIEAEADVDTESDTGSLPDQQLPTTEEHTAAELTEDKEPVNELPRRPTPVKTYRSIIC